MFFLDRALLMRCIESLLKDSLNISYLYLCIVLQNGTPLDDVHIIILKRELPVGVSLGEELLTMDTAGSI